MPLFPRGVVLPFQKGKALERGIETLEVTSVRQPLCPAHAENPIAHLPADAPVLLEHMTTFEEYEKAYGYLAGIAGKNGISI